MTLNDINTLEETADYLKLSPQSVRRLVRSNKLGFLKVGRTLAFPREAVKDFVRNNTTPASAPNPFGRVTRGRS